MIRKPKINTPFDVRYLNDTYLSYSLLILKMCSDWEKSLSLPSSKGCLFADDSLFPMFFENLMKACEFEKNFLFKDIFIKLKGEEA